MTVDDILKSERRHDEQVEARQIISEQKLFKRLLLKDIAKSNLVGVRQCRFILKVLQQRLGKLHGREISKNQNAARSIRYVLGGDTQKKRGPGDTDSEPSKTIGQVMGVAA